jgi:predicted ester cyclase
MVDRKKVVQDYINAVVTRTEGTGDQFFTKDYVMHFPNMGDLTKEAHAQVNEGFAVGFPGITAKILFQVEEGNMVASRVIWTGVHKGTFMGVPPSGKTANINAIRVDRFEGDKIVESWVEVNQMGLMMDIGAMPRPG